MVWTASALMAPASSVRGGERRGASAGDRRGLVLDGVHCLADRRMRLGLAARASPAPEQKVFVGLSHDRRITVATARAMAIGSAPSWRHHAAVSVPAAGETSTSKYNPLTARLAGHAGHEWRASFAEIEE